MSRGFGWIQRKALAAVRNPKYWSLNTIEVASLAFDLDWIEHNSSERRSTSRALKRLVEMGLIFEIVRGRYSSEPPIREVD